MAQKIEQAIFGGGCFWCTEAVYQELKGVTSVMPGYAGGETANPTYEAVCSGTTGHAEVIKVEFDPAVISYTDLLTVFFATHDPTTVNRQGSDVGTQYRSIILTTTAAQKERAEAFIKDLTDSKGPSIVTEVKPFTTFYPAEAYHRQYYQNNQSQPYCQLIISPKIDKLKEKYQELLKSSSPNQ